LLSCPQFEITDDTEAVQMLQRTSQVGEFYVMGPPVIPLTAGDTPAKNFLVRRTDLNLAPDVKQLALG
jgi:hypothetical protein